MKAEIKRTLGRTAVGIGAITCAVMSVTSGSASADTSGYITSRSNDCSANWYAPLNEFWLADADRDDAKGCAVLYSFEWDHDPSEKIWISADEVSDREDTTPNGAKWVFFKVCDHLDGHAINCTDWKQYGT